MSMVVLGETEGGVVVSQADLGKAKAYAAKLASVGGTLLSNASYLKKLLESIDPTAP